MKSPHENCGRPGAKLSVDAPTVFIGFKLPADVRARFEARCAYLGLTPSEVLRIVVEDWTDNIGHVITDAQSGTVT